MRNPHLQSLLYPLLSGILLSLTTPYFGFWQLVFLALIPLGLFLAHTRSFRRACVGTLLTSVPFCFFSAEPLFHLAGTWWVVGPSASLFHALIPYFLGVAMLVALTSLTYLTATAVYMNVRDTERGGFCAPLFCFSATWALTELLRSWLVLGGYSWAVVGYALIDATYVKHVAVFGGVYSLSFIAVFVGMWGAGVLGSVRATSGTLLTRVRHAFFAKERVRESLIFFICVVGATLFSLYLEIRGPQPTEPMRVAVISSSMSTLESIEEGAYRTYLQLLRNALDASPALVVFPENVFPFFVIDEETGELSSQTETQHSPPNVEELYGELLAISRAKPDVVLAIPLHSYRQKLMHNSIFLYQNGQIVSSYQKRKPIPFAEFSPFGLRLPLLETIAKGAPKQDFRMGNIRLAGYMCGEIGITSLSAFGARIIISPSNESVLTSPVLATQQQQFARMRALEEGAYVLRSSKGGISSVIDPYGRAQESMVGENGVIIFDIK